MKSSWKGSPNHEKNDGHEPGGKEKYVRPVQKSGGRMNFRKREEGMNFCRKATSENGLGKKREGVEKAPSSPKRGEFIL